MENAIHVGSTVEKETVENLKDLFGGIFKSAYDNRMEQRTVRAAIDAIGRIVDINNVTIQSCVINGDKTVNMDDQQ